MRITGGTLKGWQIPGGFANHVRPTTDMTREAIFNKLQHSIGIEGATVLDLFSGSGIMALEFLSRAADSVVSVDKDTKNITYQKRTRDAKGLGHWEIVKGDAFQFLEKNERAWDIIFADPPYDMPEIHRLAAMATQRLSPEGLFLLEHRPGIIFDGNILETKKYGSTAITIFSANT